MSKKVKLGDKANSFYDPTSKLKVLPGDVIELKAIHKVSSRVIKALRDGHLQVTDAASTKEVKETVKEKEVNPNKWIEELDMVPEKISKLKKEQLIQIAKFYETEYSDEELGDLKKDELVEEIFELVEVEE